MVGIIIQLAVSWLLLWFLAKKDLSVLGFTPTIKRLRDFGLFFLITAMFCASGFLLKIYFTGQQWQINPSLSAKLLLTGFWWNIKSVLFEELVFRGVLLYLLIKKLGSSKAIIISALAFGVYHWFSQELWGNVQMMIYLLLISGVMGLVMAYGYAKTYSLYIPIAIHLGWNLTSSVIFSTSVIGDQLLIKVLDPAPYPISYFLFYSILIFPVAGAIIGNYLVLKKRKQVLG